jgi:hypothetical protein
MRSVETGMDTLQQLQFTVIKDRVSLGGLSEAHRADVLALAWCMVPQRAMDERAINDVLRAALADALKFLATDHVELRRWLVDGAWLRRDGFGRVYQRTAPEELATWQLEHAQPLLGLGDVAGWARGLRGAKRAARERRREAWAASGAGLRT